MNSQTTRRGFVAAALALPAGTAPRANSSTQSGVESAPLEINGLPARPLGKTVFKVALLGFGCAWTPDPSVFARALDLGINHFDTARSYQGGNAEAMLRAGIGCRRKEFVLTTKTEARTTDEANRQLERSLKELRTDTLDVRYLHSKYRPEDISDELVEAQVAAKHQGIGVSTHQLPLIAPRILQTGVMDVVLAAYNFTMDKAAAASASRLYDAGIGLVDMKAMAGGRSLPRWGPQQSFPKDFERPGVPAASLRWVLKNKSFASALVGMLSIDELEEDLGAAPAAFTEADGKLLAAGLMDIRSWYCRMCGQCPGSCACDLPIPEILRCLMYAESYRQFPAARDEFRRVMAAAGQIRCSECSTCPVHCLNGVIVRDRLRRAQEWLG